MFILLIIIANTLIINNWELLYRGAWIPSNTTSTNIQDLINYNIIKDGPMNIMSQDQSKILEKQWIYRSINVVNITNAEIIFEGIDTIASIYVNNQKVIDANNMFVKYQYYVGDINGLLNITGVFTEITHNLDKGQFAHAQVRRAAYQFYWDFCYKLLQVGFWRPVTVGTKTSVEIRNIYIQTMEIEKLKAEIDVSFDIKGDSQYSVLFQINYKKIILNEKLLDNEENVKERITIQQPQLWWPNGYGGQPMYTLKILIYNEQKVIVTHKEVNFGIKQSKLIQQIDEQGQSFLFLFNGKQIYIKGANYAPTDMITTRIRQNYQQVFNDTLSMQCNALRIWGGGIYEDDLFYDLADKYGILIWQDFMFANAVYPNTIEFLNNVENEIRQNVERLRNHPSILLWAGNNEIHQGMLSWGYNAINGAPELYKKLFQEMIPNIIHELDPQIDYIHSSPLYLYRDKQMGEIHDWMIFHQLENIEDLHQSSGRFVSEYGNQAYPDFSTFIILKMILQPGAYQNMNLYITNYFNRTTEKLAAVYYSNSVQYMTYQTAAIAHRILKPYNMGTIFWQLQDSAALATWSVIDILKCKKGGFYAIKKFYNRLILGFKYISEQLLVYAVSEYEQSIEGQVNIEVIYIQNNTLLYNITKNVTLNQHFSEHINTLDIQDETAKSVFVTMKFYNKQFYYNYTYTIKRPNQLKLKKPEIRILLQGQQLVMTTQYFAKLVYVHNWYQCLNPSDNYFDLIPGEKKIITFEAQNLTIKDIGFKAYY